MATELHNRRRNGLGIAFILWTASQVSLGAYIDRAQLRRDREALANLGAVIVAATPVAAAYLKLKLQGRI